MYSNQLILFVSIFALFGLGKLISMRYLKNKLSEENVSIKQLYKKNKRISLFIGIVLFVLVSIISGLGVVIFFNSSVETMMAAFLLVAPFVGFYTSNQRALLKQIMNNNI
jgi:uncharacterized membrane protein